MLNTGKKWGFPPQIKGEKKLKILIIKKRSFNYNLEYIVLNRRRYKVNEYIFCYYWDTFVPLGQYRSR